MLPIQSHDSHDMPCTHLFTMCRVSFDFRIGSMSPMTGGKFIFKPRTTTMNIPAREHQAVATQGPKDFNLTTFLENLNMIQYYDTVSQNISKLKQIKGAWFRLASNELGALLLGATCEVSCSAHVKEKGGKWRVKRVRLPFALTSHQLCSNLWLWDPPPSNYWKSRTMEQKQTNKKNKTEKPTGENNKRNKEQKTKKNENMHTNNTKTQKIQSNYVYNSLTNKKYNNKYCVYLVFCYLFVCCVLFRRFVFLFLYFCFVFVSLLYFYVVVSLLFFLSVFSIFLKFR